MKAVHEGIRNFTCHMCDYTAARADAVKRHIKSMHLHIRDFKCDHCEYVTSNTSHLKMHVKSSHLKVFDHQCDECGYETVRKDHLQRHKSRVHKNGGFILEKKEVKQEHEAQDQIQRKCGLCEFEAPTEGSLTRHLVLCHVVSK